MCALQSGPILHLAHLWNNDSGLGKKLLQCQHNFFPSKAKHRSHIDQLIEKNEFFIPDLIGMLGEITHIMDGNPDNLSPEMIPEVAPAPQPLINIMKLRMLDRIFNIIRYSQKFQMTGWIKADEASDEFLSLLAQYKVNMDIQLHNYYARTEYLEGGKKKSRGAMWNAYTTNSSASTSVQSSGYKRFLKSSFGSQSNM